jgi:hypothetical protein
VRGALTFADLLDQELERQGAIGSASTVPPPSPWQPPFATAARLVCASHLMLRPTVYGTTASGRSVAPTPGEQRAFVALESLREAPVDFTPAELRAAFRTLARRYHPDRHPQASAVETAQFSRAFAAVEANYRRFLGVAVDAR